MQLSSAMTREAHSFPAPPPPQCAVGDIRTFTYVRSGFVGFWSQRPIGLWSRRPIRSREFTLLDLLMHSAWNSPSLVFFIIPLRHCNSFYILICFLFLMFMATSAAPHTVRLLSLYAFGI